MSHRYRIMKKPQAPPVRRRRRPRQGSSSETRPCRVLTGRVRNPGGGGGGRAREAGRGGRRFSRSCRGRCRPGARVRDAGAWGAAFFAFLPGVGGGKGMNRGYGGCTDRDAFAVPSAVAALCRPCSSGRALQQWLAPGRLPAACPRPLGDAVRTRLCRIPGRVVNRAVRLPRTSRSTSLHTPHFPRNHSTQLPNLPAVSAGRTPE